MKHIPYDNPVPEGYEELKIGNMFEHYDMEMLPKRPISIKG